MSGEQLGPMPIQHGDEFIVLKIAESSFQMALSQKAKMSEQLSKSHIGGKSQQFTHHGQGFLLCIRGHGSRSPIFGSLAKGRGSCPITSTLINWPGAIFATRVARVTPL